LAQSQGRKAASTPTLRIGPDSPLIYSMACWIAPVLLPAVVLDDPRPELAELLLVAFEPISDIGGVVGAALLIGDDRQIATHRDRILVSEEEEAIAAKQILHIVLGGRNENVDALIFEQGVESCRVKGSGLYLMMSSCVHVVFLAVVLRISIAFLFRIVVLSHLSAYPPDWPIINSDASSL
jgi:hypothetical protein